ncbi:MAG: hypothetical protein AAGA48_15935 [Myxococcota bacterium]
MAHRRPQVRRSPDLLAFSRTVPALSALSRRPSGGTLALFLLVLACNTAWGWTPEALADRLASIQSHRQLRTTKGAPIPGEGDLRKVANGNIVTGLLSSKEGNRAYGVAIVPLSIGRFWAALNDETRHPGYTAVEYSELLDGSVCREGRKVLQFLPIPVPFVAGRWWIGLPKPNQRVHSASGGAVRELAFSSSTDASLVRSPGGQKVIRRAQPIGYSRGAWFLVALDENATYVEYYLHSDPGSGVPTSMAAMFATKGVRNTIQAIQRFAKEAKPSCAIE